MELTKQQIEELRIKFIVDPVSKEYKQGLEKVKRMILKNKEPVQNPVMTLLGGQQGSGKTQLLLLAQDNNVVRLSLDEFTIFHPMLDKITDYPDLFAYLTYQTGLMWRNEIYNELVEKKYNVITEGTLRDESGTIQLAEDLRKNGYVINAHVMSTGIIESGLSVFERYEEEIKNGIKFPRLTECVSSYKEIPKTIKRLEEEKLFDSIKIFTRGDVYRSNLIYNSVSDNKDYKSAYECLNLTRELDNMRAIHEFDERFEILERTMKRRNATKRELMQLENFKTTLFRDFIERQISIDKGGSYHERP